MSSVPARLLRKGAPLLGAAASAALISLFSLLSQPWVLLGWVLLVPWLWVLEGARSARAALGHGLALALAYAIIIYGWFPRALADYTQLPLAVCLLIVLLLAPVLQPQFLTFALARYVVRKAAGGGARWLAALTGALVYVGTEGLFPKLFHDTLGQCFLGAPYLRQAADLAGAHGLTLVLLLANECVLAAGMALAGRGGLERRRALAPSAAFVGLVAACSTYGYLRYRQVEERTRAGDRIVVGLVQANITKYDRLAAKIGTYQVVRTVLDTHYAMSDELLRAEPDLLVWPETVYPTSFGTPRSEEGAELDQEIADFVAQRQVPLIFGAYDSEDGRDFNAAVFLPPPREGRRLEFFTYRKGKLFPLTEGVPDALETPWVRRLLPWTGTWKPGPGPQAVDFELRGGRPITLAPLICYDAIFPGYAAAAARKGAQLIVTLSNDSWFAGTPAPRLHLMVAAFRSIETHLPQVRVTNSGISALISPTGEILTQTPSEARAALNVTVPRLERIPTLMVAWGDWLGPVALGAGTLLVLGSLLAARRRSGARSRASGTAGSS